MTDQIKRTCETCRVLYDGKLTPHRSCGMAMAETFGLPSKSYQALRKGGLTGKNTCGVIQGGRMVLGELLGDPDPTHKATASLVRAAVTYEERVAALVNDRGAASSMVCNDFTGVFDQFKSQERHDFCCTLAADVAGLVAEIALDEGAEWTSEAEGFLPED